MRWRTGAERSRTARSYGGCFVGSREGSQTLEGSSRRPPATPQLFCWDALFPTLPQVHRSQPRPSLCSGWGLFPVWTPFLCSPPTTHGARLHRSQNASCPLPQGGKCCSPTLHYQRLRLPQRWVKTEGKERVKEGLTLRGAEGG